MTRSFLNPPRPPPWRLRRICSPSVTANHFLQSLGPCRTWQKFEDVRKKWSHVPWGKLANFVDSLWILLVSYWGPLVKSKGLASHLQLIKDLFQVSRNRHPNENPKWVCGHGLLKQFAWLGMKPSESRGWTGQRKLIEAEARNALGRFLVWHIGTLGALHACLTGPTLLPDSRQGGTLDQPDWTFFVSSHPISG